MFTHCTECRSVEAKEQDGLCPYVKGEDNLPLRCVGRWSEEKLYYLSRYMEVFNTATRNKWSKRAFIDLFAGPGKCIIRDEGRIVSGSTLLAFEQKFPFSVVVSVDINGEAVSALKERGKIYQSTTELKTYEADCNLIHSWIRSDIDSSYIALVLIDPTSMQIKFSTIKYLTVGLKMDLIINYPLQAINRAYKDALNGNDKVFNEYFGTTEWKKRILEQKGQHNVATKLLPLYKQQLNGIGYMHIEDLSDVSGLVSDEILVTGPRNIPLYYLFLASKNPLGNRLWQGIKRIRPDRQGQLF